jgi:protein-disulfide isomerase
VALALEYSMSEVRTSAFLTKIQDRVWIFPALSLVTLVIGQVCQEKCAVLRGDILGLDLNIFGMLFYSLLLGSTVVYHRFFPKDWLIRIVAAVVAAGIGAELILVRFMIQNDTYCPKCLISGFFLLAMFFVVAPRLKKWVAILLIAGSALFTSATFSGSVTPSYAQDIRYPVFGNEKAAIEIIVYSDYFCPACGKVDEQINVALRKLKNTVAMRFVDVPLHANSLQYAELFLYAWFESGNNLEAAIRIREALFDAAKAKTEPPDVMKILAAKGIPLKEDKNKAREIFLGLYNPVMKTDKIGSTPSLVVVKGGSRKTYVGGAEILKALAEITAL